MLPLLFWAELFILVLVLILILVLVLLILLLVLVLILLILVLIAIFHRLDPPKLLLRISAKVVCPPYRKISCSFSIFGICVQGLVFYFRQD